MYERTLDVHQRALIEVVVTHRISTYLSGAAGSGKSYTLAGVRKFARRAGLECVVTAMTGTAATLIDGQTLHSWAGLGLFDKSVDECVRTLRAARNAAALARWREVDILVVDEVSMLDEALFDKLDRVAAKVRGDASLPLCLLLVGDFAQIPPIDAGGAGGARPPPPPPGGRSAAAAGPAPPQGKRFCFQHPDWRARVPCELELEGAYRQQDDSVYLALLGRMRLGDNTPADFELLRDHERACAAARSERAGAAPAERVEPTKLLSHRNTVEAENLRMLAAKCARDTYRTYEAKTRMTGGSPSAGQRKVLESWLEAMRKSNTAPTVTVAVGAQVLLTCNVDVGQKLANGSRGVVTGYSGRGFPLVRFLAIGDKRLVECSPYGFCHRQGATVAHYKQVPLKLAFAITIHKSQGMTLDSAEASIGTEIWETGQAYVALSRIKNRAGLDLRVFRPGSVRCDPRVRAFYARLHAEKLALALPAAADSEGWSKSRRVDWLVEKLVAAARAKQDAVTVKRFFSAVPREFC